jgi:hypothetical protein
VRGSGDEAGIEDLGVHVLGHGSAEVSSIGKSIRETHEPLVEGSAVHLRRDRECVQVLSKVLLNVHDAALSVGIT